MTFGVSWNESCGAYMAWSASLTVFFAPGPPGLTVRTVIVKGVGEREDVSITAHGERAVRTATARLAALSGGCDYLPTPDEVGALVAEARREAAAFCAAHETSLALAEIRALVIADGVLPSEDGVP